MKQSFKLFLTSIITFAALNLLKVYVFASAGSLGIPQIPNPTVFNDLEQVVNFATSLIRPIFIITFIGMILYAAAVWLTSQGDDAKIKTARNIIVAAIVGMAIAVFAPAITGVVASFLGVDSLNIFTP